MLRELGAKFESGTSTEDPEFMMEV